MDDLYAIAGRMGISVRDPVEQDRAQSTVQRDLRLVKRLGIHETPTIIEISPGSVPHVIGAAEFEANL